MNQYNELQTLLQDKGNKLLTIREAYVVPNIPEKKIKKARAAYAKNARVDEIVLIIDDSLWGDCKEGLVFTTSGFYIKEMLDKPKYINYMDIEAVKLQYGKNNKAKDAKLEIYTKDNGVIQYGDLSIDKVVLKEILDEIIILANQDLVAKSKQQTGNCKKGLLSKEEEQKCHAIIHTASVAAAGVGTGLAQIPLSDNALIIPIQVTMVISLGAVFNMKLTDSAAKSALTTVATSMIGRSVSQVLCGWIPVAGNAINASTAAAVTETAGWSIANHFASLTDEERIKYSAEYKQAKQEGYETAKAEASVKFEKLKEELERVKKVLSENKKYEYFIIGAFAIGIAASNIDDDISNEEIETLQFLISGLGYDALPQHTKEKIYEMMFINKPTLDDAIAIINKVDKKYWGIYDKVVEAILGLDETDLEKKKEFRSRWTQVYVA